jgi:general secretion pathway protein F
MLSTVAAATTPAARNSRPVVTVDDLRAFNMELAALVRAGIPLETGLATLARSGAGQLSELANRIELQLQQGLSLVDALRQEGGAVTPVYLATVEAALRADQLPIALVALTEFGRTSEEIGQRIRLALLYPRIVTVLAYLLFCLMLGTIYPYFHRDLIEDYGVQPSRMMQAFLTLSEHLKIFGVAIPLILIVAGLGLKLWISTVSGADYLPRCDRWQLYRRGFWLPGVRKTYDDVEASLVSGLLALLVRHEVPLAEALRLVAPTSSSRRLADGLELCATAIQSGADLRGLRSIRELPALLRETLVSLAASKRLGDGLDQAALVYQRRAVRRSEWLRTLLPTLAIVVIGGGVALLYCLSVVLPMRWMYLDLFTNIS